MTAESIKAVVREMAAAIERHDLEALAAHPGLYETVQHIPMMWTAFPDLYHTIEQQFVDGDVVTTCAILHGTHQGPLLGIEPTGRSISTLVITVDRVVDGKIVLHYGLPDWMGILGPLGLLPGVAAA